MALPKTVEKNCMVPQSRRKNDEILCKYKRKMTKFKQSWDKITNKKF